VIQIICSLKLLAQSKVVGVKYYLIMLCGMNIILYISVSHLHLDSISLPQSHVLTLDALTRIGGT